MRASHPAVKEARRALEQELKALTRRISVRRAPKRQYKTVDAGRDQAKEGLTSPFERAEANRPKRSHQAGNLPENPSQKEPADAPQMSEPKAARRYGLERIMGTAGRLVRWVKALFRR